MLRPAGPKLTILHHNNIHTPAYMYILASAVKGQIILQVELLPRKTKNNFEGLGQTFQEISTVVHVSSILYHTNNVTVVMGVP